MTLSDLKKVKFQFLFIILIRMLLIIISFIIILTIKEGISVVSYLLSNLTNDLIHEYYLLFSINENIFLIINVYRRNKFY